MELIECPAIKVHQNIGDLYLGVMKAHDLFHIAKTDRIRLESLKIPKYAGFQRALVSWRVDEIRDYLNTPRSTFPNALILNLDSEFIEDWAEPGGPRDVTLLKIRREPGAVTIIDGQHRAAALDAAASEFSVIVSIFIDLKLTQCAEIFAKINSTQKAVNPSIAFQLFGYAEERSPQRTAHEIAEVLNTTKGSPFYRRLRMLGTKDAWSEGRLSQATFCKELMRLYTRDPLEDENRLLRGERTEEYSGYPLRKLFIRDQDKGMLELVWKYFVRVAETWPDQWLDKTGDSILPKTTGYAALMAVLRKWLLGDRGRDVETDRGVREGFAQIRERYNRPEKRFVRLNYPAGNQGVTLLRDSLMADLNL